MNSIIFSAVARWFFWLMLAVSLYVFYRGHNEPGGGFVGGLIAACGFAVLALAQGIDAARRALRFEPMVVVGAGILATLISGVPGLVLEGSYLTHIWVDLGGWLVGTTLLYDLGVYLVVLGGILAFVLRFYEGL